MESYPTVNTVSCERRVNIKYLINGYSRENCKSSSFIPSSVIDVISYYYPSMNGHAFVWILKNTQDLMSLTSNVIDSDVFDVGLSNTFFLRLETNPSATKTTYKDRRDKRGKGTARPGPPRIASIRRSYGGTNYLNTSNTNYFNEDQEAKDAVGNDNMDNYIEENQTNNMILSLMSFPLRATYISQIIHCELYFDEVNLEYSTIWNQNENDHKAMDPYVYGAPQEPNNDDIYIEHKWVINYDLDKYYFDSMRFECKINILQIIFKDTNIKKRVYAYSGYDDVQQQKDAAIKPYNYVALPLLNANNNKMKFVWNIVDKSIFDKLTGYNNYKGHIQFHSDVFYDMFELQIGRENDDNYFQIQICGLPAFTNKMGVKLQIFAMDMNNEENKTQIMSNVVTFSYNSPTYRISNDKTNVLIDLLSQCKHLSLLCVANIIYKYDKSGNDVKNNDEIKQLIPTNIYAMNDNENLEKMNNGYHELLEAKRLKCATDWFLWEIVDETLLNRIKTSTDDRFPSEPFKLLGYKWYITIYKFDIDSDILIAINCILDQRKLDCMLTVKLLQTSDEQKYYERFDFNWTAGYFGRYKEDKMNKHTARGILVLPEKIKKLNQISIKVTVGIIDNSKYNDSGQEEDYNDVKIWLRDTVGLDEYYHIFVQHGIDDLETVKLLSLQWIQAMGINKVGHHLKLLHKIEQLNKNDNSYSIKNPGPQNNTIKWILTAIACFLGFASLYRIYVT